MQNNEQNLKTPSELQPFFFGTREILVFENSEAIFDLCAGNVFQALGLVTTHEECDAIYNALAVKHIAPPRVFVNEKGKSASILMLNLEGVKHLAKPTRSQEGKAFWHWATVDLPTLAKQAKLDYKTQSVGFQIFNFGNDGKKLRSFCDISGNIWFVAKDICDILALDNVSKACDRLQDFEKTTITISDSASNQKHPALIVSESGFYTLVFKSQKPNAEKFRIWVTNEVLPTLRKTGKYEITPKTPSSTEIGTDTGFTPTQMQYLQKIIREAVLEANLTYQEQLAQIQKILPALVPTLVECKPSYVYLGQNQDNANCKVGKSNEPLGRIFELELGGSKIKLLATLKLPSEELALLWEELFHKMFKKYDLGRDWFNLPPLEINTLVKLIEFLNGYYEAIM